MILLLLALLCLKLCEGEIKEGVFIQKNEDFLWGVATASYQIEGAVNQEGRLPSIWDTFAKMKGNIANNDNADIADDSYNKVDIDIELLKKLGVNAYRFSIAWTRIIPKGYGSVNVEGINHYNSLISKLIQSNIEPVVTLFHWDLPQELEDRYGGILSPQFEADFVNYADVCFNAFGDRVKKWITINEPWTVSWLGYGAGIFAPGKCSDRQRCTEGNSSVDSYLAAHNLLNAHAAVVSLYRTKYAWQEKQKGIIGITLNQDWAVGFTNSSHDQTAAHRRRIFQLAWFADPIFFGDYPTEMKALVGERLPEFTAMQKRLLQGSVDFLGMNHYTTKYFIDRKHNSPWEEERNIPQIVQDNIYLPFIEVGGWSADQRNYETKYNAQGKLIGPQGESPWLNIVPWGFHAMLSWIDLRYANALYAGYRVPFIVTENGCDAPGEYNATLSVALNDTFRIQYFDQYLAMLDKAIAEGIHIYGYFAWSFLDNFEWADGYDKRFGLYYVDFQDANRTRYAKASAHWYAKYLADHSQSYLGLPYYEESPKRKPVMPQPQPQPQPPTISNKNNIRYCTVDTCSWWEYYTNMLVHMIQRDSSSSYSSYSAITTPEG